MKMWLFGAALLVVALLSPSADAYSFLGSRVVLPKTTCRKIGSASISPMSMKLFDWKRREADESWMNDPDYMRWTLHNIKPAPGSRKRKKRKGRGIAAGQGASCGFGMRGQKSRSGRSVRPGFEGGQTPLYLRLPKYPGRPLGPGHKRKIYNIIKLDELNETGPGETVNFDILFEKGRTTKSKYKIHKIVVGREEFTAKNIIVQAHAFTKTAKAAIEAAGGTCQYLKPTTNEVMTDAQVEEAKLRKQRKKGSNYRHFYDKTGRLLEPDELEAKLNPKPRYLIPGVNS